MKSQFQPRPQSKSKTNNIRPTSKYVNSEQATETFKKAKGQQQNSNYQKAIELYMRSTMYDPNYFQAYCNAGSCYRHIGKYLEARFMYLKSISIKKDDAISHYNLANIERIIGDYEAAIIHYQFVIALKENLQYNIGNLYLDALVNLGICYKNIELLEKAEEIFAKASGVEPNDEISVFNHAMTVMKIIQKLDCNIFQELVKEKTIKAEELFKKLLLINPNSEISKLQLIKISALLDKSQENLKKAVNKLQEILKDQKLAIKDQVTQQLAYILKQLQQYQASAKYFQKSLTHLNQRKNSTKMQANIYEQPNALTNQPNDQQITEEQGVRMAQDGNFDQARRSLQKMKDNQSKRIVQMAIELEQASRDSQFNLNSAIDIYQRYFFENKKEFPFDKISIEGHKVIGKLLSMQGKFDESITHFEYISQMFQSNTEKSKIHGSLASDYQAKGDKENALREYKIALQQEPENYEMMYNIGCCLNDAGHNTESLIYFKKFLERINLQDTISAGKKRLFIADCLVTMSICSVNTPDEFDLYDNASNSLREVQDIEEQGFQFKGERIQNFYQRWAELLEERIAKLTDKRSQDFIRSTQKLLEAYKNMLFSENCHDRDAVLSNSAIIYYGQRLFINSLASVNQITKETYFQQSNLALIYLHLGEHWIAYKSISNSTETDDAIVQFNEQVFNWIYGVATEGRLLQKYPNQNEQQQLYRWRYALVLIDDMTKNIDECKDKENEKIKQVIDEALREDIILSDETQRIKLAAIIKELKQPLNTASSNLIKSDIINLCIIKSQDVPYNFNLLLKQLSNKKQLTQTSILTLINLFIFTNADKRSLLLPIIQQLAHQKKETINLELDKRVTLTEDLLARQLNFSYLDDIVINFSTWECQSESKLVTLIRVIENYYYHSKFKHPLQIKHNFPRHAEYHQCTQTLKKILTIIYNTFKVENKFEYQGKSLSQLKYQIIQQVGDAFQSYMLNYSFITICLGQKLTPITLEGNFQNKEAALEFVKALQKQCNNKKEIEAGRDIDKIVVAVSGFITMNLTWIERIENALTSVLRDLSNSPIDLYMQSIMNLQATLETLKQTNPTVKQLLQTIPFFKS